MKKRVCPNIQLCPTCGHMRIHHPGNKLYECGTRPEVLQSLREYRDKNGKNWKAKLCAEWESGKDTLREARNTIGPRRLYLIKL